MGEARAHRLALNLVVSVALESAYPGIPTCVDCQAWVYDVETWRRLTRGGKDVARPPGTPTPCVQCPKGQPDSKPHPEKEMLPANREALEYYWLCQADPAAVVIPRDETTVRNNALIGRVLDQLDRGKRDLTPMLLAAIVGGKK